MTIMAWPVKLSINIIIYSLISKATIREVKNVDLSLNPATSPTSSPGINSLYYRTSFISTCQLSLTNILLTWPFIYFSKVSERAPSLVPTCPITNKTFITFQSGAILHYYIVTSSITVTQSNSINSATSPLDSIATTTPISNPTKLSYSARKRL